MEISFHKPYITEDEITEVVDSIRSGWLTMGPKTIAFEEQFRNYIGSGNAVSMNSCTACLHLALKAIGLQENDEVIIPALTFAATAEVITYFKARPVIADVDRKTFNLDVSLIENLITSRTKAVIPVHFAGQPCDMDDIISLAQRHGLTVIEDAAHALPARYRGKMIGTIGDITCFSFYATKTMTTGEGGMATCENDEWAERMRILRLHGISKDPWKRYTAEGSWYYEVVDAGYKYNMTDIQSALGIAQLRKVDWMWEQRKKIAAQYTESLSQLDAVTVPHLLEDRESAWHLYVIQLNLDRLTIGRNQFIEELKTRGVLTSVHFIPLYRHPYYSNLNHYDRSAFPSSEAIYERIISLPVYPGMTDADVEHVVGSIAEVSGKFRR